MVNAAAAEGLPPVFTAVMFTPPALTIKLAGTAAVSCVELTNVVVSAVTFQRTMAPARKFVPFTVSVNAAPPMIADVGLRLVIAGVGTLIGSAAAVEALPPVLIAVMLALPRSQSGWR